MLACTVVDPVYWRNSASVRPVCVTTRRSAHFVLAAADAASAVKATTSSRDRGAEAEDEI